MVLPLFLLDAPLLEADLRLERTHLHTTRARPRWRRERSVAGRKGLWEGEGEEGQGD